MDMEIGLSCLFSKFALVLSNATATRRADCPKFTSYTQRHGSDGLSNMLTSASHGYRA